MQLHWIDSTIILIYFVGDDRHRRGRHETGVEEHEFLLSWRATPCRGGCWACPNASGMLDITGTMWLVYILSFMA